MRTALALITLLASPALAQLRATTDPRVEIISIVFRIAGNPQYNQGRINAYLDDIGNRFAPHESHRLLARFLRASRGAFRPIAVIQSPTSGPLVIRALAI